MTWIVVISGLSSSTTSYRGPFTDEHAAYRYAARLRHEDRLLSAWVASVEAVEVTA